MSNMFFVGREKELGILDDLYKSNKFEMLILHGRRRIGKSYLLTQFANLHKDSVVYFSADKSSEKYNVQNFCEELSNILKAGDFIKSFQSWRDVFSFFNGYDVKKRLVIIIDEWTYLFNSNPVFDSILQNAIDKTFKQKDIFLILCGSEVSTVEDIIDNSTKPLYGRKTSELKLEQFSYNEIKEFFPKYDNIQCFMAYSIAGGIPFYLSLFDDSCSIKENIIKNCLSITGYLFSEIDTLLRMELKEPHLYKNIMAQINCGASNLSKISQKIYEEPAKVAKYLSVLINLGLVERKIPCGDKDSSRKALYSISDNYLAFYFTFIFKHHNMLNGLVSPDDFYQRELTEEKLSSFLGFRFENICLQYLKKQFYNNKMPFIAEKIGRWWGSNPITKRPEEIDILALGNTDAMVCECKYTNAIFDEHELKNLQESATCINKSNIYYTIFSKNGVTPAVCKVIDSNPHYSLVTLDDLYAKDCI